MSFRLRFNSHQSNAFQTTTTMMRQIQSNNAKTKRQNIEHIDQHGTEEGPWRRRRESRRRPAARRTTRPPRSAVRWDRGETKVGRGTMCIVNEREVRVFVESATSKNTELTLLNRISLHVSVPVLSLNMYWICRHTDANDIIIITYDTAPYCKSLTHKQETNTRERTQDQHTTCTRTHDTRIEPGRAPRRDWSSWRAPARPSSRSTSPDRCWSSTPFCSFDIRVDFVVFEQQIRRILSATTHRNEQQHSCIRSKVYLHDFGELHRDVETDRDHHRYQHRVSSVRVVVVVELLNNMFDNNRQTLTTRVERSTVQ